jgi:hypothetical protein
MQEMAMDVHPDTAEKSSFPQEKDRLEFFRRDYEMKVDFLVKDLDRLWGRFRFFVTFQTALFGAVGFVIERNLGVLIWLLSIIGLGLSLLWALVGYEDRILVERYRGHVRQAFSKVASVLAVPADSYVHVGEVPANLKAWTTLSWVPRIFSITRLPIWVAGSFALIWIALLFLRFLWPHIFQKPV